MKTYLIVLLVLVSSSALAATTGTLTLSGIVPAVTSIIITPAGISSALDVSTAQTALNVATVTEDSNATNGYSVTVSSVNAGKLKNGTNLITYIAKYNAVSFVLQATPVTVTTQGAQTSVISVNKPVTIGYAATPFASVMQGTYSDTLTFTIIAN